MSRDRFLKLDLATRQGLASIATRHFARQGFERASLNAILSEAQLSKGSYYYYFDDKEDLFATVLEDAFEALVASLPLPDFEALQPAEFWPTVERFVGKWVASFDLTSDIFQAALKLSAEQRKRPRFATMLARSHAIYRTLIESGQALGCVRDDLPLSTLVRLLEANDALLDAIFLEHHQQLTSKNLREHVKLVFGTFKRLLVPEPPERKPRRRRG